MVVWVRTQEFESKLFFQKYQPCKDGRTKNQVKKKWKEEKFTFLLFGLFSYPFVNFLRIVCNPVSCGFFRGGSVFDVHHDSLDIVMGPLEAGQDAVEVGLFFFEAEPCKSFNMVGVAK